MELIQWVEVASPWHWLVAGLVCVLLDIFLGSIYLVLLGISVSSVALWSWLGCGGELQLAFLAGAIVISAVFGRNLIGHEGPSLSEERQAAVDGAEVTVLWVDPEDPRRGRGAVAGHGECLLLSESGPLSIAGSFNVVEQRGMRCVVAPTHSK